MLVEDLRYPNMLVGTIIRLGARDIDWDTLCVTTSGWHVDLADYSGDILLMAADGKPMALWQSDDIPLPPAVTLTRYAARRLAREVERERRIADAAEAAEAALPVLKTNSTGVVKWWRESDRTGYIVDDSDGESVYIDRSSFESPPSGELAGKRVAYWRETIIDRACGLHVRFE